MRDRAQPGFRRFAMSVRLSGSGPVIVTALMLVSMRAGLGKMVMDP